MTIIPLLSIVSALSYLSPTERNIVNGLPVIIGCIAWNSLTDTLMSILLVVAGFMPSTLIGEKDVSAFAEIEAPLH